MRIKANDIPESVRKRMGIGPKVPKPPRLDPFKNPWERDYNAHLMNLWRAGEIQWFEYEPMRLRIGVKPCWYKVDFLVLTKEGRLEGHEVKGRRRAAGIVRIKAAAKQYPFIGFLIVKPDGRGGWNREGIGTKGA